MHFPFKSRKKRFSLKRESKQRSSVLKISSETGLGLEILMCNTKGLLFLNTRTHNPTHAISADHGCQMAYFSIKQNKVINKVRINAIYMKTPKYRCEHYQGGSSPQTLPGYAQIRHFPGDTWWCEANRPRHMAVDLKAWRKLVQSLCCVIPSNTQTGLTCVVESL